MIRTTIPALPGKKSEWKDMLSAPPLRLSFFSLEENHHSRLCIRHNHTDYECFFIDSIDSSKMYILLNSTGEGTKFSRASYADTLDGHVLCIDDPSRKLNKVKLGYFFGTYDNDITQDLCDIIARFRDLHGIKNEDLIFIGSSNAGFASCKLSSLFLGAKSINLSPIIDVQRRLLTTNPDRLSSYKTAHYLDDTDDVKKRLSLGKNFKNNQKNKHFFIYNDISSHDKYQLEFLCKMLGFKYSLGLNRQGNNFIYVTRIKYRNTHLVGIKKDILRLIEDYMYNRYNGQQDILFTVIGNYIESYMLLEDRLNRYCLLERE